jgi:MarC family integral membrane protein
LRFVFQACAAMRARSRQDSSLYARSAHSRRCRRGARWSLGFDLSSSVAFDLSSFAASFVLPFSVTDVALTVPLFLSLTEDCKDHRAQIVSGSVVTATIILPVLPSVGQVIFQVLGITVDDLKIAGGA